jgi:hypothetical protein
MTIKDKQKFEAHFNCIGHFLVNAYEKSNKTKRKRISVLMNNLTQMYVYTNKLEVKLLKIKHENKNRR